MSRPARTASCEPSTSMSGRPVRSSWRERGAAQRHPRGAARSAIPTLLPEPRELVSRGPGEPRAFAASLAGVAAPGDVLCLWGELGAGKTVFAKGFGAGLGVSDTILSPSFVLMGEYAGRLPLFHIDLYRLATATEALDGGLLDDRQASGVVIIEWPDRLGS